jgi:hypothetical protein
VYLASRRSFVAIDRRPAPAKFIPDQSRVYAPTHYAACKSAQQSTELQTAATSNTETLEALAQLSKKVVCPAKTGPK